MDHKTTFSDNSVQFKSYLNVSDHQANFKIKFKHKMQLLDNFKLKTIHNYSINNKLFHHFKKYFHTFPPLFGRIDLNQQYYWFWSMIACLRFYLSI